MYVSWLLVLLSDVTLGYVFSQSDSQRLLGRSLSAWKKAKNHHWNLRCVFDEEASLGCGLLREAINRESQTLLPFAPIVPAMAGHWNEAVALVVAAPCEERHP